MMWLALVLGVLPFVWLLLHQWNEIWYVWRLEGAGANLPPGHMGFPFFGELLTFLWYFKILRRPDEFINSKRRKYGDNVGLHRTYLFGSPAIIAWSPSVNKYAFQSDDSKLKPEWPTIEILGKLSVAAAQGKAHARLRSCVTNAVNKPDALRGIAVLVQPRIISALQSWAHKGKIIARNETKKVTFENIGKMFASLEPGPLLDTMDQLFAGLMKGIRATPLNFPGTAYHHAFQSRKKLLAIFKAELEKKNKRVGTTTANDLMDGLMQISDEEGNKLSDEEVLDNIVGFVVAGYESTALSSMWALYYLAKSPDVLKKLREENMAISQKGEYITSEDVSKMKYTNKVVEETIRMANVAAFAFRTATRDIEYKGYIIPKGWKVIQWMRYVHTNSENFDDPMCFNPDRWNEPAKPGTYLVFGGGQRICAGNMLARLQLSIFLHHLSVGYKWELLNPDAKIIYLPHPKLEDGLELSFSRI